MNPEFRSRLQFALTASFHFIFPPISMGLRVLLVWMAWKRVRTGDPVWRQASVFWVKVYGLMFALGIATGLVPGSETWSPGYRSTRTGGPDRQPARPAEAVRPGPGGDDGRD